MSYLLANPILLYVAVKAADAAAGSLGTWLKTRKKPWLRTLGHKLEAFFMDVPKLLRGKLPELEDEDGDREAKP